MKKVRIKLFMNGGFTFDLWLSSTEFNEFNSNMIFWKTPGNDDDGLYAFYNTSDTKKWSNLENMVTIDCRQIVAYEVVGMYNMDEL